MASRVDYVLQIWGLSARQLTTAAGSEQVRQACTKLLCHTFRACTGNPAIIVVVAGRGSPRLPAAPEHEKRGHVQCKLL